jgi:plastocyanin
MQLRVSRNRNWAAWGGAAGGGRALFRRCLSTAALAACSAFLSAAAAPTQAAEAGPAPEVAIHDHTFVPSEIHVKAGVPVVLHLRNEDATAEEFDSSALKVEKVVAGHGTATVRLRPLKPGRYPFVGEYHEDTARGTLIAE